MEQNRSKLWSLKGSKLFKSSLLFSVKKKKYIRSTTKEEEIKFIHFSYTFKSSQTTDIIITCLLGN